MRSVNRELENKTGNESLCEYFSINAHNNISLHLIAHFNSFILVQEREFYDDLNPSYRFLNILHLKYDVTRINREAVTRTGDVRKTKRVATFGSTFSNSLLKNVLKHGFLPFNSSKDMNFQTVGYTLMTDA